LSEDYKTETSASTKKWIDPRPNCCQTKLK